MCVCDCARMSVYFSLVCSCVSVGVGGDCFGERAFPKGLERLLFVASVNAGRLLVVRQIKKSFPRRRCLLSHTQTCCRVWRAATTSIVVQVYTLARMQAACTLLGDCTQNSNLPSHSNTATFSVSATSSYSSSLLFFRSQTI